MEIKFVLDFDGVLFDSAFEAYEVSNLATRGLEGYRQDVTYDEFLQYRSVVTDAWHYNRLYSLDNAVSAADLHKFAPDAADKAFSDMFFAARATLMGDANWVALMRPYPFFEALKPVLQKYPERFAILSTRNLASLHTTLAYHDVDIMPVFGQEDIRRCGSKLAVAEEQHWLDDGKFLIVYVDDMNSHLEPFEGQIHLPLHANWGYDQETPGSLSEHQIMTIITSLLSLCQKAYA